MRLEERAKKIAALFNHYDSVGANWRDNAPLDATVSNSHDVMWVDGIRVARGVDGQWVAR